MISRYSSEELIIYYLIIITMKYITIGIIAFLMMLWWITYAYDPVIDVSSWAKVNTTIKHPLYRESMWSYDLYISSGVYLRVLNTWLTIIRSEQGSNARTIQSNNSFDLTVNGGYFTYDSQKNTFMPAGRIIDGLRVIRSMVKEFFSSWLDKNLAVTVTYDRKSNIVTVSHNDLVIPTTGIYARYTWPQIIQSGQIMTGINNKISHRQRRATRTFMIIDKDGNPHLWVTITWYTLPALAQKIKDMKVFYGSYHVINMDGGSSTSFAAGTRYRSSRKRLPWFFGVK